MRTFLILAFLLLSVIGFSQASMTDKTYEKLIDYREELADNKNAKTPDQISIKKTENCYCVKKYTYQFDYVIDEQSNKKVGLFITCTKEKRRDDKFRYIILPFNNNSKFIQYTEEKELLGYTMEKFLDRVISHLLTQKIDNG